LTLTAMLEGLYNGSGTMRKAQDASGNHFTGNTADQVMVELHSPVNYGTIVYSTGNVNLSTTGTAIVTIPGTYNGSYYVTVKHRNSIETTTAAPVAMTGGSVSYNFSTAAAQAYGSNLLGMGGVYVIWGGDVNQDGIVDTGDMNPVENESTSFTMGYVPEDVNGDGIVDTGDMNMVENNSTTVIQVMTP
jgi:hypothetical protein